MGLSDDQKMGTAGIDDVLSCQLSSDNSSTVYAKDMWNPKDQETRVNEINDVSCRILCMHILSMLSGDMGETGQALGGLGKEGEFERWEGG